MKIPKLNYYCFTMGTESKFSKFIQIFILKLFSTVVHSGKHSCSYTIIDFYSISNKTLRQSIIFRQFLSHNAFRIQDIRQNAVLIGSILGNDRQLSAIHAIRTQKIQEFPERHERKDCDNNWIQQWHRKSDR